MSRHGRPATATATAVGGAALLLALSGAGAGARQLALDPGPGPVGPVVEGGNDCAGGEIYDDGTAENGYTGDPAFVDSFEAVQLFVPAGYPATYDTACVCLTTIPAGGPTLDLDLEVRADDGAGGSPGTLLGALPVTAAGIPNFPANAFFAFDVTGLTPTIPSGQVWIGVRWNPMAFPNRFLCADETATTPLRPGYLNFNNGMGWQLTQTVFAAHRAKLIRAVPGIVADLAVTKGGVVAGDRIVYTVTVTNHGPADATNVVVTDPLPAEVTYAEDDCGGLDLPPWTWNVGGLLAGASAVCHVTVDVDPRFEGLVSNTASVTADQTDPAPGNGSSTVELFVGGPAGNPLEIPTLGAVGLAVLALLLVAGAIHLIRRRATA